MYPIKKLTEFNQALVYGFDVELFHNRDGSAALTFADFFSPEVEQYLDMLQAYQYAQDEILPTIQKTGIENITEAQFFEWLFAIHHRIGKSLLLSMEAKSGEYTKEDVDRWQQTTVAVPDVMNFINDLRTDDKAVASFVTSYSKKYNLSESTCLSFANMTKRYHDEFLKEWPIFKIMPGKNFEIVKNTLEKLKRAAFNNNLSATEQQELNKILIFCMPAEKIPQAMKEYVKETLNQWRTLKTTQDLNEQAKIIAEIFYKLTHIHPFANGNGRTATCLINIILKSIGLPDIILRYPGERNQPSNEYEKAMRDIMYTREPFAKHIVNCINRAQIAPFHDNTLAQLVEQKVLALLGYRDLLKNPTFNNNKFMSELSRIRVPGYSTSKETMENSLILYTEVRKFVEKTKQNLARPASAPVATFTLTTNPFTLYKDAIKMYREQQYAPAIQGLKKAIEEFQKKTGAFSIEIANCYSTLTSAYRDQKEYDLALETAEQALICYDELKRSDNQSVMVKYSECLSLAQKETKPLYDLAVSNYTAKHYSMALAKLNYCIQQWADKPQHQNSLAMCYSTLASCQRELGAIEDALNSCEHALKICSTSIRAGIETKQAGLLLLKEQQSVASKSL
ncbi:MAG: Fic family protein [Legionella sp.]|jgi:tetratricopeptide (TPR) repeat protein